MNRIQIRTNWHTRRGGGLLLGLRLQFPVATIYGCTPETEVCYMTSSLTVSLIAFSIHFDLLLTRVSDL